MSSSASTSSSVIKPHRRWLTLTQNPVVLKELRGRMRGARAFVVLTAYLAVMIVFVSLLYAAFVVSTQAAYNSTGVQIAGKFVFGAVVLSELFLVCFIAPAFTASAVSGERERQTYDLLRTTLLTARALVWGKLASSLSYVLLLLLAAFPLHTLAFLLGGVAPEEVLIASVILVATAFLFDTAGLFFSALMRRTLGATVLTYAFALLATMGLPALLVAFTPFVSVLLDSSKLSTLMMAMVVYIFGLLVSMNPIATAVATEVILIENHTALYFTVPVTGAGNITWNIPLVSPWVPYTLFCFVLGVLMVLIATLAVRRTAD